jgi:ribosome biogenesis GTPase
VRLPGGALILDTPGMREFGLLEVGDGLDATFEDIDALARECRFRDCGHANEPGCAVRAALETGALDEARWKGFQKLQRELNFLEAKEDRAARQTNRKHWIAIAKANKASKKIKGEW